MYTQSLLYCLSFVIPGYSLHILYLSQDDIASVSYTHLDVYKRQIFFRVQAHMAAHQLSLEFIFRTNICGCHTPLSYKCILVIREGEAIVKALTVY